MSKEIPNLKIKFNAGAFDKSFERAGLQESKNYTKQVNLMNKQAEVLDRYDEFSNLSLSSSNFKKKGEYGIEKIKNIHVDDERLLKHQVNATKQFLKELRGFGLLADVVGSGKTFEACSVLSELCAKGKINSALIIVPSQVYDTWVEVLEMKFGLGKGCLNRMGKELDQDFLTLFTDGFFHPNGPIIVCSEDFVRWKEHQVDKVLFDVVVVDEAHNLCVEEGENARALKLLSVMMTTKKQAKKTYCVLLSATPHSGNLEQMFRLWYFIRCKGGSPEDFDEKTDAERTIKYRKEKRYYKEHICRGASTVMEFIDNVKYVEVTENYGVQFDEYLKKIEVNDFNNLLSGEKKKIIESFLDSPSHDKIRSEIIKNVASAYHNGVLRSIMIRQTDDVKRKGKRIENFFFFPAEKPKDGVSLKGLNEETIYFYPDEVEGDKAIKSFNGDFYSIDEYVKQAKGNLNYQLAYAKLYFDNKILNAYGLTDGKFSKANSLGFYWKQLQASEGRRVASSRNKGEEDERLHFLPVYNGGIYNAKLEKLKNLLTEHKDKRILVFFDYDVKKENRCYDQVLEALKTEREFESRIIVGNAFDKQKTIDRFQNSENAILIVTDNAFTEGANLQKCNIIVNFQVTPNPLAMEQRIGRIFRLGQENDVTIYSFADMTALEGYVLMYFNRIGLLTSNSGDAAIIAGSNNDNMVTIRCPACGKVKLLSKDDYESYKKNDSFEIYCADNEECRQESQKGLMLQEINSNEEMCDHCRNVIQRQNSNDGGQFHCLSVSSYGSGVMCSKGEKGDRTLYCRKICAISHCQRFMEGSMKGKCNALNYYLENPTASDSDLQELCDNCKYSKICDDRCKIGSYEEAISGCMKCSESACMPKPHVITFDENWEAECPVCKDNGERGTLRPVVARTFETYIRSAFDYQQDGGKSFCENLGKECQKVAQIKEILSNDKEDK